MRKYVTIKKSMEIHTNPNENYKTKTETDQALKKIKQFASFFCCGKERTEQNIKEQNRKEK